MHSLSVFSLRKKDNLLDEGWPYHSKDNLNPHVDLDKERMETVHALEEAPKMLELSEVDSLKFAGQEFVHQYMGVPMKAKIVKLVGDGRYRVKLYITNWWMP